MMKLKVLFVGSLPDLVLSAEHAKILVGLVLSAAHRAIRSQESVKAASPGLISLIR